MSTKHTTHQPTTTETAPFFELRLAGVHITLNMPRHVLRLACGIALGMAVSATSAVTWLPL
ncbi:hypothetical protein [Streptomyces sp. MS1.AVA.4]|uniref:Uncharacterized protein n=1 Tax=Streptomyces pratisoli TaxID=3139917 RepID=A0ACC6QVI5_9ACTN